MKWNKKVKDLVIGGNLAALEFAFREGFPVFYDKLEAPFHLEQTKEGINKKDVIENYAFLLSLSGLNLSSHLVNSYRIEENKLTLSGKKPWVVQIEFEKIHDFNDRKEENDKIKKVIDYINIRSCGSHDIRELKTEEDFVKEIYFYPSQRANSSKKFSLMTHNYETVVKDAMVVSYLTNEQVQDEEYSPIYSRLRLLEIMKEVGIKGKRCGTKPNGKEIRASIKLEFDKREINEVEEQQRNFYYTKSKKKYLNTIFGHLYARSR